MAFTRKWLAALGIEEAKVDEIIAAHTEVTDALKTERDSYKADAGKYAAAQAELDRITEEAAKNGGKNPFEVKYNAVKEEFEKFKADVTAKETKAKKESAYRAILKAAGVSEKRIDAVLRVSDVDSVEIGDDGKIKGEDKILESVKKEWADFIPTSSTAGVPEKNPPQATGNAKTKEDIMKITDAAERQKAIAENHELFGF